MDAPIQLMFSRPETEITLISGFNLSEKGSTAVKIIGNFDSFIRDINAETPCITASGHNLDVAAIAFSADGNRLASTGSDGLINIWDAHLTTDFLKLKFQENTVQSLKYSPDGKTVATIGIDDTVIILNSSNWKEQQSLSP